MHDSPAEFLPLEPASWFYNAFTENHIQVDLRLVSEIPESLDTTCITEQTLFQYTPSPWRLRLYWTADSIRVLCPETAHTDAHEPTWLEWTNKFANHWAIEWLRKDLVPYAAGSLPHVVPADFESDDTESPRWIAAVTLTNQRTGARGDVVMAWFCPIADIPDLETVRKPGWSIDTGALLDMLPMGAVLLTEDSQVVRINNWLKQQEPSLRKAELPQSWSDLFHPDWLRSAWDTLRTYQRATYYTPWLHPYDSHTGLRHGPYTLSLTPSGGGAVLQLTPLMEKHRAFHHDSWDRLTGLRSRAGWLDAVSAFLKPSRSQTYWVGVFGLDGFQTLNDTLGHDAGDWLLKEIASRATALYPEAIIGRWAGDEFCIFAPGALVDAPFDSVLEPDFKYKDQLFHQRCSGGIMEISPDRDETASKLVQYAEWALREAKEQGGNQTLRAVSTQSESRKNLFYIENGFSTAVQQRQFFLLYQPLIDLKSKRIVGAEALLRWKHPDIGLIQPQQFIPVAEQTGAIIPLTSWVLDTACREARTWVPPDSQFFLSINLSPSQFYDPNLVENITGLLSAIGFSAKNLKLEITEGVALQDTDHNRDVLNSLLALGVGIAIDDFGTGFASLSYLKNFPAQQLKIDRSFVQGLHRQHNCTLTKNIIDLAHNMGMLVVAEGVETEEQERLLTEMNCDILQGYRYSKPIPPEELLELLDRQKNGPLF